jgi:hypothetical protein
MLKFKTLINVICMRIFFILSAVIFILGATTVEAQNWSPSGSLGLATQPAYRLDMATEAPLDGIRMMHNNQKMLKIHGGSLHAAAYNVITQDGDAGIIYGSTVGGTNFGFVLAPWSNTMSGLRMDQNGNVGIGIATSSSPLTVSSNTQVISLFKLNGSGNTNIAIANNSGQLSLGVGAATPHPYAWSTTGKFFIGNDGDPTLFVNGMANGNVGIGCQDTKGYKLAVAGNAIFTKVTVKALPWADYVFNTDYRLRPLSEVEQYIKEHHHLPEVPGADEVEKNGIDVGDNQATLLKKIEELTLYVIEQNKKIEELQREVKTLKKRDK